MVKLSSTTRNAREKATQQRATVRKAAQARIQAIPQETTAPTTAGTHFFSVPRELRDEIKTSLLTGSPKSIDTLSFMACNSAIRDDAASTLIPNMICTSTFNMAVPSPNPQPFWLSFEGLPPFFHDPIRHIRFNITDVDLSHTYNGTSYRSSLCFPTSRISEDRPGLLATLDRARDTEMLLDSDEGDFKVYTLPPRAPETKAITLQFYVDESDFNNHEEEGEELSRDLGQHLYQRFYKGLQCFGMLIAPEYGSGGSIALAERYACTVVVYHLHVSECYRTASYWVRSRHLRG